MKVDDSNRFLLYRLVPRELFQEALNKPIQDFSRPLVPDAVYRLHPCRRRPLVPDAVYRLHPCRRTALRARARKLKMRTQLAAK